MTGSAAVVPDPERRLRILHCFRNPVGGLFRHVRDLCDSQSTAGHAVGVICDSTTGGAFEDQLFAELEPKLALGLTQLPMKRQIGLSDVSAARQVLRAALPLVPDVLHGHGAKGGAYARFAGTRVRKREKRPVARIYTPHGGSMHYDAHGLKGRAYFTMERLLERMTDAFLFVSRYEADAYAHKVGAPKPVAEVVPNGLRPEEFAPIDFAADARDFVYVGMLRDLKGPDVFLEALRILGAKGRSTTAHIYGAGDDEERYRATVRDAGLSELVEFRPPTPAREAFATGRALVVPSRAESMPYIVLEAAAAGMPMIATNVGGIPEIFETESARLVPPGDASALADAMAIAIDDRQSAKRDAERLRAIVQKTHTVAAMAASVERVYRQALDG